VMQVSKALSAPASSRSFRTAVEPTRVTSARAHAAHLKMTLPLIRCYAANFCRFGVNAGRPAGILSCEHQQTFSPYPVASVSRHIVPRRESGACAAQSMKALREFLVQCIGSRVGRVADQCACSIPAPPSPPSSSLHLGRAQHNTLPPRVFARALRRCKRHRTPDGNESAIVRLSSEAYQGPIPFHAVPLRVLTNRCHARDRRRANLPLLFFPNFSVWNVRLSTGASLVTHLRPLMGGAALSARCVTRKCAAAGMGNAPAVYCW